MPHDPVRAADTKAWLQKALLDLRTGTYELGGEPALRADVVFHAQQAAEKAMKAYLAWHDRPFRKTHSLEEIGAACAEIDPSLRTLLEHAVPLSEYAWRFRYPGEPEEPPREEAEGALATAREIYEALLARLPAEVRP